MYEADSGQIEVFDQDIKNSPPTLLRRKIGYVLQQSGLFPHWTVAKNIGLVPRLNKQSKNEIESRVNELLNLIQMPPNTYRNRYPAELSGGQQQRVGIARALAAKPQLILFDEPFSALDPITRADLQNQLKSLKEKLNLTGIFVTHDVREAFALGDKVMILNEGKMVQMGTPAEIKANPKDEYVKRFIGDQADA